MTHYLLQCTPSPPPMDCTPVLHHLFQWTTPVLDHLSDAVLLYSITCGGVIQATATSNFSCACYVVVFDHNLIACYVIMFICNIVGLRTAVIQRSGRAEGMAWNSN